jgi:hypothetical protein
METMEKASEEGQKIVESIITGKELLGLERTMSDAQLEQKKQSEKIKSQQEIDKLKGEMGGKKDNKGEENKTKEKPRNLEDEITQLRRQLEKQEEEKEKYYEQQKERQKQEREKQQAEYNDLAEESTNPAKQKKSRGSAFINKKQKHKPDQSQMSATQEFKGGKID